jgi:KaiC/GvpD/RAD55 family RecA-like ATPase
MEKSITLGYPLDILFNRTNLITNYKDYQKEDGHWMILPAESDAIGGIIISDDPNNRCTGNIVIRGRPGTGKSTLGLQIAVSSVMKPNFKYAAYIPLEEDQNDILIKANSFGWRKYVHPVCHLHELNEFAEPNDLGKALSLMLTQPQDCPQFQNRQEETSENSNKVIIPKLSPRNLDNSDEISNSLFWTRFQQLERLLIAAENLRKIPQPLIKHCTGKIIESHERDSESHQKYDLRVVVIDSINVMGNQQLSREQLFRIFDLFKRYNMIGIFIVEDDEKQEAKSDGRLDAGTIEYLADMIISLTNDIDSDYFVRYFEIVKSRFQHQVYGKHPFKIRALNEYTDIPVKNHFMDVGCTIFPSLHHLVIQTENQYGPVGNKQDTERLEEKEKCIRINENRVPDIENRIFKIGNINNLLPKNAADKSVITISGQRGTFKSSLAINLLVDAMLEGDDVLLIRFRDRLYLQPKRQRVLEIKLLNYIFDILYIKPKFIQNLQNCSNDDDIDQCISKNVEEIMLDLNYIKNNKNDLNSIMVIKQILWTHLYDQKNAFVEKPDCYFNKNIKENIDKNTIFKKVDDDRLLKCLRDKYWNSFEQKRQKDNMELKKYMMVEYQSKICKSNNEHNLQQKTEKTKSNMIEVDFRSGNLLPEEFVEVIRRIYYLHYKETGKYIKRAVIDDVGLIGVSYPFLKYSKTANDLFLTTFVHLMRNYNINLIMVGTSGLYSESDNVVQKAETLGDSVLKTNFCDVFGEKYVTIVGEVQSINENISETFNTYPESIPSVIQPGAVWFKIDNKRLEGLVGFESGKIIRPGLSLQLFKGGIVHDQYNKEVLSMVRCSFGLTKNEEEMYHTSKSAGDSDVNLFSFDSPEADVVYRSANILNERPINNTIVRTVDEFMEEHESLVSLFPSETDNEKNEDEKLIRKEKRRCKDYYKNILIIAYNVQYLTTLEDIFKNRFETSYFENENYQLMFWRNLKKVIDKLPKAFMDFDYFTTETLNCALLDIVKKDMFKPSCSVLKSDQLDKLQYIVNDTIDIKKKSDSFEEVVSFQKILNHGWKHMKKENRSEHDRKFLEPKAGFWLCWYSQLRQFFVEQPMLAPKIGIMPLPYSGFKGDWFIGIANGSVSVELGRRVISILTSKEEQYKRFSNGVGMPIDDEFYKKENGYFGWSMGFGESKDLDDNKYLRTLYSLKKIHDKASRRKQFIGYPEYRGALEKICIQLMKTSKECDAIRILERMPNQIKMLSST